MTEYDEELDLPKDLADILRKFPDSLQDEYVELFLEAYNIGDRILGDNDFVSGDFDLFDNIVGNLIGYAIFNANGFNYDMHEIIKEKIQNDNFLTDPEILITELLNTYNNLYHLVESYTSMTRDELSAPEFYQIMFYSYLSGTGNDETIKMVSNLQAENMAKNDELVRTIDSRELVCHVDLEDYGIVTAIEILYTAIVDLALENDYAIHPMFFPIYAMQIIENNQRVFGNDPDEYSQFLEVNQILLETLFSFDPTNPMSYSSRYYSSVGIGSTSPN